MGRFPHNQGFGGRHRGGGGGRGRGRGGGGGRHGPPFARRSHEQPQQHHQFQQHQQFPGAMQGGAYYPPPAMQYGHGPAMQQLPFGQPPLPSMAPPPQPPQHYAPYGYGNAPPSNSYQPAPPREDAVSSPRPSAAGNAPMPPQTQSRALQAAQSSYNNAYQSRQQAYAPTGAAPQAQPSSPYGNSSNGSWNGAHAPAQPSAPAPAPALLPTPMGATKYTTGMMQQQQQHQHQQYQPPQPHGAYSQQYAAPPLPSAPAPPLPSHQPHQFHQQHQQQQQQQQQHRQSSRPPPPTYCCHKCNTPGHWIQDCSLFVHHDRPQSQPPQYQQQQYHQQHQHQHQHQQYQHQPPQRQQQYDPQYQQPYHGAPPLPTAPPPSQGILSTPPMDHSKDGDAMPWHCEPCDKHFALESQLNAHVLTHVPCTVPDCEFTASKRVVGAHYQTAHGQFSGNGLKEIDVEGQKFMVLVGNSPEDIAKWRAERRSKWPSSTVVAQKETATAIARGTAPPTAAPVPIVRKRKRSASSEGLEDGEIEESDASEPTNCEEEQDGQADPAEEPTNDATTEENSNKDAAEANEALEEAEPSPKRARRLVLCAKFLRNQCRFGDRCKFSHDRAQFACRALLQRGECAKGESCGFSHDAAVVAAQKELQATKKSEKVLEEQWKAEKGSLLRKLLKNDIAAEQQQILQIVRYVVQRKFFDEDGVEYEAC